MKVFVLIKIDVNNAWSLLIPPPHSFFMCKIRSNLNLINALVFTSSKGKLALRNTGFYVKMAEIPIFKKVGEFFKRPNLKDIETKVNIIALITVLKHRYLCNFYILRCKSISTSIKS